MKKGIRSVCFYFFAFFIPVLAGIRMFQIKQIAPFGPNSVLNMDLWGQYFPMYVQQFKNASASEFLFSWNGALGYNNWAQGAYYTDSALLFLLKFVPVGSMVLAMDLLCLLRISLSSLTCFMFLKSRLVSRGWGRPDLWSTGIATSAGYRRAVDGETAGRKDGILMSEAAALSGAVAYSLCAYAAAFLTQPMWTAALIYTPLILMALDRLIRQKKGTVYTLLLTACIVSSFYIGFAVCLFCLFWFLSELPDLFFSPDPFLNGTKPKGCQFQRRPGRQLSPGGIFVRFALYSLLAGGCAAVVLLPVLAAISGTVASGMGLTEGGRWYFGGRELLAMLLPDRPLKLGYSDSGVNIYTGLMTFILLPLFFFNTEIPRGRKIAKGLLLMVLFLSMNLRVLEYIWHGFHIPNQLPGRWTFLFSLTAACLCAEGLACLKGLRLLPAVLSAGIGTLAAGLGKQAVQEDIPSVYYILFGAGCCCLILAGFFKETLIDQCFFNCADERRRKRVSDSRLSFSVFFLVMVSLIQMATSVMNFNGSMAREEGGMRVTDLASYSETMTKYYRVGKELNEAVDGFFRAEPNPGYTFNPSMLGDFGGMSYYSSTMNGEAYRLFRCLGNRVYARNVSTVYNLSSPLQNGLWGIRYYVDFGHDLPDKIPGSLHLLRESEDADLYENPTALGLAYVVDEDALTFEPGEEVRAIHNQERFLDALTGEKTEVFSRLSTEAFWYENCSLSENKDWDKNYFLREDSTRPVTIHYIYVCEKDGPVFLESNYRTGSLEAGWEDGKKEIDTGRVKFAYLGSFSAGDEIRIEFRAEEVNVGCCGLNLYRFDEEKWEHAYSLLAAGEMEITLFENTLIRGEIETEKEELVLASLVQDGGWSVTCDGKPAQTELAAGILPVVQVPPGRHVLEFRYRVPGLRTGCLVSLLSLLVLLLLTIRSAGFHEREL